MDAATEQNLRQLVRQRMRKQVPEIEHSLRQIAAGNPLGAEPRVERSVARIAAKASLPKRDAEAFATAVRQKAELIEGARARLDGAEALQGPSIDFVGVEFLALGRLAANAVGRVVFRSGRAQGSGFLVAPGLFLTNNHVIPSQVAARQMVVEFDYETDAGGGQRPITAFEFDPGACFVFDPIERLDFTLIGIGPLVAGNKSIAAFGYLPLSDAPDKHMLGEIANIIQHPQGRPKELVVRENNLISRDETAQVLHYLADTEKGSSGSPVCNNAWEPIALHHWGEPALEMRDILGQPLRSDVNEGVRVSAIVKALRSSVPSLTGKNASVVDSLLRLWNMSLRPGPVGPTGAAGAMNLTVPRTESEGASQLGISQRVSGDGTVTWTLPIEFSVKAPWAAQTAQQATAPTVQPPAAPAILLARKSTPESAEDFSDRSGYEPGFISGLLVPLPDWSGVPYRIAENQLALQGEDPHELLYHHFSIVMNAERRLAAFTACNIDGRRVVAIDREKKTTKTNPTLKDLGVESLEGAEASDDFSPDPRILDGEQMAIAFYEDQKVPGFDKPGKKPPETAPEAEKKAYYRKMSERTARMFQKGHIIMRGDPGWGTPDQALLAEEDTFYYTNAAPQFGFFNQGSPEKSPGAKGKLRWRAVETYVLRNAVTMRKRICVFAGPIFENTDVDYRFDSKIPMRFWKLIVWKGQNGLQSIGLIANQRPVLDKLTKGVPESAEAFNDDDELTRVSEFLSSVEEIEGLTHLRFSDDVRAGDIRQGAGPESALDFVVDRLRRAHT
jgi:endonuclease G, mitochondrial